MAKVSLLVGLGNPGPRYEGTRHNAGFLFVDRLARQSGASFREEKAFEGELARLGQGDSALLLLKPLTYMNRSGQSVRAITAYYKIPPEEVMVAHDDLDLPLGACRIKTGGGHGGHNGLRDITAHLGTAGFARVRFGIGRPETKGEVLNFVLGPFARSERELVEQAFESVIPQLVASHGLRIA